METPCSEDWSLLAGRHVQIRKDGRLIRTGRVDTVTRAANALWLEGHGAQLRTLFEKAEGYTAWPVPEGAGAFRPLTGRRPGEQPADLANS